MREQFADQAYNLHNPEQTSTPMVVRFNTMSQDFASYGNSMYLPLNGESVRYSSAPTRPLRLIFP